MTDAHRTQRVLGALVGSVVGDALGAPFEFGPAGQFSERFPSPARGRVTEMCGGGAIGWRPGEWTDDTQMALMVAASLLEHGGVNEADLFDRFQRWVSAGPADVGIQTRRVLTSGEPWQSAAKTYFEAGNRAAGNGSLMRSVPAAIFFSRDETAIQENCSRRVSAVTHGDPSAGDGCALYFHLISYALMGVDPLRDLANRVQRLPAERRSRWQVVLAPEWEPTPGDSNGDVWSTLAIAVWALRQTRHFETAMRLVIDLGGDTDTIACVTGGLLGAVVGIQGIPSRWTTVLNGSVPGHDPVAWDLASLYDLGHRLIGKEVRPWSPGELPPIEPTEVLPGVWLTNLGGASSGPEGAAVISLCRTGDLIAAEHRRSVYLIDDASNLDAATALTDVLDSVAAFREEGVPVVVHCYGGASRTGLVYRALLMREKGLTADEATTAAADTWPHLGLWNSSFDTVLAALS